MKHARYYPIRHAARVVWLTNFKLKLAVHAAALGLTVEQVAAAVADCGWMEYLLGSWLPEARPWSKACTSTLHMAESGTETEAMTLPVFTPPALPDGVVPVVPGAQDRIFALVRVIKNSGKCTDEIAADLCLIGAAASAPDLSIISPILGAKVSGSEVLIKWGWQGLSVWLSSCEIQVDRADGKGFVLLTIDTTPNFIDKHAFPGNRTVWTYKAIYRAGDVQVGRWSQTVSMTVG